MNATTCAPPVTVCRDMKNQNRIGETIAVKSAFALDGAAGRKKKIENEIGLKCGGKREREKERERDVKGSRTFSAESEKRKGRWEWERK